LAPIEVEAPVAKVPFHPALVTVTSLPACDQVPLQPCDSRWSPA
jgi:hypothetical protein